MKTNKIFLIFCLLFSFALLLPNFIFAQGTSADSSIIGQSSAPPSYLNYIWSEDPNFFNEEWVNDLSDTFQVFHQDGIPPIIGGQRSKGADFEWYREVYPDNNLHPIPDEGFRLYHAMETPDSAVLVAELVGMYGSVNPEKVGATVQVSFYDGNNILGAYMHYKSLSKERYVWKNIPGPLGTMKHITAFSINLSVNGDTSRMGSTVRLYDYKLYKGDSVIFHDHFGRVITDVEEKLMPTGIELSQNYPNPFNPATVIKFKVPSHQAVTLKVYDVLGRKVATLVDEEKSPGNYEVSFDGSNLASGMYVYVLQAGSQKFSKKMLLVR